MNQRTRKLIGTLVLVAFVVFYSLTVMTIAAAKLPGTSILTQSLFFVIGGFAWVIPAAGLIFWMGRGDRPQI